MTNQSNYLDPWLFVPALILLGLGLLIVTSASMVISDHHFGYPFHFLSRQLIAFMLSLLVSAIVLRTETKTWQAYAPILLLIGVVLLILVLVPGIGKTVNGSRRWINLGIFRLQVSEFMKLFFIIYLSDYLTRHREDVRSKIIGFIKPLLILAIVAMLLLLEPDFGATSILVSVCLCMLFLAGVPLLQFVPLLIFAGSLLATLAIIAPYRLMRLTAFLNPWTHAFQSGYQLTQSLMAFGRGGIWGAGLGNGIQKLFYLPEAHTDFLFAVLAEELGLVGQLSVCLLFVLIVYRAFYLGRRAYKQQALFKAHLACGLGLCLGIQALVNIGVNIGLLPTKGLTLPLMSYGGSSLLASCISIAMLLRIATETTRQPL